MANTKMEKLLIALLAPFQDAEDTLRALLTERMVDTAVGAQLDQLGVIVTQPRNGQDDDTYRRYIRARIAVNKSSGSVNALIRVVKLVLGDVTSVVELDNQGVATAVLRILDEAVPDALADDVITMLNQARAGGVRVILESSELEPTSWLRFDEGNLDEKYMLSARDEVTE